MNINFNTSKNVTPQFGMAIKAHKAAESNVKNYLFRNIDSIEDTIKLNKYIESQKHNPVDIYLSTEGPAKSDNEKLTAIVGGRKISDKNPLNAIKKAITYANEYHDEKIANETKNSGLLAVISKIL